MQIPSTDVQYLANAEAQCARPCGVRPFLNAHLGAAPEQVKIPVLDVMLLHSLRANQVPLEARSTSKQVQRQLPDRRQPASAGNASMAPAHVKGRPSASWAATQLSTPALHVLTCHKCHARPSTTNDCQCKQ